MVTTGFNSLKIFVNDNIVNIHVMIIILFWLGNNELGFLVNYKWFYDNAN